MNPLLTHELAGERQRDLMTEAARARPTAPGRRLARRAVLAAVLPTALAAAVLPSAAQAGTAFSLTDGTLMYSDSTLTGERNNVTMRSVNGKIVISDTTPLTSATSQCKVFNGELECASHPSVRVILGSQDDRVEYRLPHAGLVQMGGGNDTVTAGVRESAGQAIQPVTYFGEQGFDAVSYATASSGVTVDMADNLVSASAARPEGGTLCVFRTRREVPGARPVPPPTTEADPPVVPTGMRT